MLLSDDSKFIAEYRSARKDTNLNVCKFNMLLCETHDLSTGVGTLEWIFGNFSSDSSESH